MNPLRQAWVGALVRALPAWRWTARLRLAALPTPETLTMNDDVMNANEALVAMPLPAMLTGLGQAVATANMELSKVPGPDGARMRVTDATIELAIAISVDTSKAIEAGGKLALKAFSVNASYSRAFNFKEEASSKIRMTLAITPGTTAAPAPAEPAKP